MSCENTSLHPGTSTHSTALPDSTLIMLITDVHPQSTMEDTGFRNMVSNLNPIYELLYSHLRTHKHSSVHPSIYRFNLSLPPSVPLASAWCQLSLPLPPPPVSQWAAGSRLVVTHFHEGPVVVHLLTGLQEVASVRPHGSMLLCHDGRTCGGVGEGGGAGATTHTTTATQEF